MLSRSVKIGSLGLNLVARRRSFTFGVVGGCLVFLLLCCDSGFSQQVTPKQKQAVRKVKSLIDRAGKQYQADKLNLSQQSIEQAMKQVADSTVGARREFLELLQPEYARLQKAHRLLIEAGQQLPELAPLPEPLTDEMAAISFKSQVAPILVAKCGNCHVNRNRGNFSAATYAALSNSTTIAFGLPQDSRLIEVIENGEMPKGGLRVEPGELELLKKWIQLGAKFDGDDPQQPIRQFAADVPTNRTRPMEPTKPTGKETVSFGLHVAPILIENCGQCHINNNPRGNLSMASFRGLLAGGDAGSPLVPGKAAESLLFQRIEAGEMPPTGKLDIKSIELIGKWIDEGASFGDDPRLDIEIVAAKAKSDSQTHDQLVDERMDRAQDTWKLVMHDEAATSVSSPNFVVIGSHLDDRLTDVSELVESLVPEISTALRRDTAEPLVKGNIALFLFEKRYDFSEFGKMVERREFPKEISGHWGFNTVDAYAAVLMPRNQTPENIKILLTQQIVAIQTASLAADVPAWFADGVGYWTAKKIHGREEAVKSWDADAWAAASTMNRPDDFIKNRMPSDQAALVSYLFVKTLKSDGARFRKLIKLMQEGKTFADSFQLGFGSAPDKLFGTLNQRGR